MPIYSEGLHEGHNNEMNDLGVEIDSIFRANPWGDQGIDSPALKMAFMACFNVDMFKKFIFASSFLSRFDLARERIENLKRSDVELMRFGFDWIWLKGSQSYDELQRVSYCRKA